MCSKWAFLPLFRPYFDVFRIKFSYLGNFRLCYTSDSGIYLTCYYSRIFWKKLYFWNPILSFRKSFDHVRIRSCLVCSSLFNTGVVSIETLAYGGFLFSVPHIFFSLRTWASGKGWFAIVFHSGWNFTFLMMYCGMGLRECSVINDGIFDAVNIIMAITTVFMVYPCLSKASKEKMCNRFLYLLPVVVLLVGLFFLLEEELKFLS